MKNNVCQGTNRKSISILTQDQTPSVEALLSPNSGNLKAQALS